VNGAAVGHEDTLAMTATLPLSGLRDRALMCLPRGTGIRSVFDTACAGAGFQPRIALEASNLGVLARLASLGLGVAILPESVALANVAGLHSIEIAQPRMRGRVALAWRSDGPIGPAAQAPIRRARISVRSSCSEPGSASDAISASTDSGVRSSSGSMFRIECRRPSGAPRTKLYYALSFESGAAIPLAKLSGR